MTIITGGADILVSCDSLMFVLQINRIIMLMAEDTLKCGKIIGNDMAIRTDGPFSLMSS
jgi:hypothetical protein